MSRPEISPAGRLPSQARTQAARGRFDYDIGRVHPRPELPKKAASAHRVRPPGP
ncbi:hypothetical protein [Kitasatospora sp. NPDC093102]|uniref:hypothetical protein n=1 Tax=Kitasatospora sp. NPDC093102 TaxID=3155069 RepID=UPI00343D235E